MGGWREGERPASRGAACNRGRGVRAVSRFSAAQPSPNRCAAVPRAAASSCRLAVHRPSLPGASFHPCPGAVGRPHRPPVPRPRTSCAPSRRPGLRPARPFPGQRCAVRDRSGVRAGGDRPSSRRRAPHGLSPCSEAAPRLRRPCSGPSCRAHSHLPSAM